MRIFAVHIIKAGRGRLLLGARARRLRKRSVRNAPTSSKINISGQSKCDGGYQSTQREASNSKFSVKAKDIGI